jgi:hypothetical protein
VTVNSIIPGSGIVSASATTGIYAGIYASQSYSSSIRDFSRQYMGAEEASYSDIMYRSSNYQTMSKEQYSNVMNRSLCQAVITGATTCGTFAVLNSGGINPGIREKAQKAGMNAGIHFLGNVLHQSVSNDPYNNPYNNPEKKVDFGEAISTAAVSAVTTFAMPHDSKGLAEKQKQAGAYIPATTNPAQNNSIPSALGNAAKSWGSEIVQDARGTSHSFELPLIQNIYHAVTGN